MQAQTAIYTKDRTLMRARAQAGFMPAIRNCGARASSIRRLNR
jgi:hypothetical protein